MGTCCCRSANDDLETEIANDDLETEITVNDFVSQARVGSLALPNVNGVVDIKLVSGLKLLRHILNGKQMLRRQVLEENYPEIFCSVELTRALVAELSQETQSHVVNFPGIVALSYAWLAPNNPDPEGKQLRCLAPLLEWYSSERAKFILRDPKPAFGFLEKHKPTTHDFGIFIDFMSMYQADEDGERTPEEAQSFKRALRNIGLLYGHAKTMLFKLTQTPGAEGERTWVKRGWCNLERRLGDLISPPEFSLDISAWDSLPERTHFGTRDFLVKSQADLAMQGDTEYNYSAPTLQALRGAGRGAPVGPDDFQEELRLKAFGFPEDIKVCADIYRRAAVPLLAQQRHIDLSDLQFGVKDWEHFRGSLPCFTSLERMTLWRMDLRPEVLGTLFDQVPVGAHFSDLSIFGSHGLGCAGVSALVRYFCASSGPFSNLAELDLRDNNIRAPGCLALADAFAAGAVPSLTQLKLCLNPIESKGIIHLANIPASALLRVGLFGLEDCSIDDKGALALAKGFERGILPSIRHVSEYEDEERHSGSCTHFTFGHSGYLSLMDNTSISVAGRKAIAVALKPRADSV